jgi:hypothetical protein
MRSCTEWGHVARHDGIVHARLLDREILEPAHCGAGGLT